MDNSQFETSTNNALLEIQRAQRVLDEAETKMKKFRKQKQSASKMTNFDYTTSPLPDLKEYLEYLINSDNDPHEENISPNRAYHRLQATTQIRHNSQLPSESSEKELHNYKKTEKAQRQQANLNPLYDKTPQHNNLQFLDLKKHTQEQLQKSHIVRLERIQAIYKEQFEVLDKKIEELLKNRDKIKKDKILLLRDNEELQQKIEVLRSRKIEFVQKNDETDERISKLRAELIKLQKKLAKIESENEKIVKKKEELETNMRVCIRNSKEQLEGEIGLTRLRENKSKSAISYKCPYH